MPIDAILFGGRRATVVPLVREAFDWQHGVFIGSIMSSETTAAAAGRRRQAALRPVRDAAVLRLPHGRLLPALARDRRAGRTPSKLPKLFNVNWFRKDADGKFLWPGFGENSRVLAWIFRRCEGTAEAVETPVGYVPAPEGIDTERPRRERRGPGRAAAGRPRGLRQELPAIHEHFARFGDRLPEELRAQLEELEQRLKLVRARGRRCASDARR